MDLKRNVPAEQFRGHTYNGYSKRQTTYNAQCCGARYGVHTGVSVSQWSSSDGVMMGSFLKSA
jgi:hypothetical protein